VTICDSFLGFYQQLIKDFSHIMVPLNQLEGKEEWKWTKEKQNAFKELKYKITTQLVLVLSRREGKFRIEVDASGYAIGGVLSQEQMETSCFPIKNNVTCGKKLQDIQQETTGNS